MRRKRPYTEPDRIKERIRAAITKRRAYQIRQKDSKAQEIYMAHLVEIALGTKQRGDPC